MGLKLNLTFLFFLKMLVWQSLNFSSEMSYSQISFTSTLVEAILLLLLLVVVVIVVVVLQLGLWRLWMWCSTLRIIVDWLIEFFFPCVQLLTNKTQFVFDTEDYRCIPHRKDPIRSVTFLQVSGSHSVLVKYLSNELWCTKGLKNLWCAKLITDVFFVIYVLENEAIALH